MSARAGVVVFALVAACGSELPLAGDPPGVPAPPRGSPPPLIASFDADSLRIEPGTSTTLRWSVANADALAIEPDVGVPAGSSAQVAPAQTTTYVLTATNDVGSATASVTVDVVAGDPVTPGDPGGSPDVVFTLDAREAVHPISRFVYGYNASSPTAAPAGTTYLRLGGNRWTAYDWENNASNAGSDWRYSNDAYLSSSSTPGEAIRPTVAADRAAGLGTLVTLPMQGWVARDEDGPVSLTASPSDRFLRSLPRKGAPFAFPPDLGDGYVYQDEYVAALGAQIGGAWADTGAPVHLALDNEPDLWSGTHPEIQREPLTCADLLGLTVDLASAVKDVAPGALVFGPVSYGWDGFRSLQGAPDSTYSSTGEWFLQWYLEQLKSASDAQGRRLLDVLDIHWYSEARGTDHLGQSRRVTDLCATCNDPGVRAARVQAPRSLRDDYVENSWITGGGSGAPIRLLPRLRAMVASAFPGTGIALTEYNHGGGDDVSGAVAEADTLGILGEQGVLAAAFWPLTGADDRFVHGAFRMFRDYDGAGGAFGDTSFSAVSSDDGRASVYASYDATAPERRVVVVAANKTDSPLATELRLVHTAVFAHAEVYQLTSASTYVAPAVVPARLPDLALPATNALTLTLPAYSVTTLVLLP